MACKQIIETQVSNGFPEIFQMKSELLSYQTVISFRIHLQFVTFILLFGDVQIMQLKIIVKQLHLLQLYVSLDAAFQWKTFWFKVCALCVRLYILSPLGRAVRAQQGCNSYVKPAGSCCGEDHQSGATIHTLLWRGGAFYDKTKRITIILNKCVYRQYLPRVSTIETANKFVEAEYWKTEFSGYVSGRGHQKFYPPYLPQSQWCLAILLFKGFCRHFH